MLIGKHGLAYATSSALPLFRVQTSAQSPKYSYYIFYVGRIPRFLLTNSKYAVVFAVVVELTFGVEPTFVALCPRGSSDSFEHRRYHCRLRRLARCQLTRHRSLTTGCHGSRPTPASHCLPGRMDARQCCRFRVRGVSGDCRAAGCLPNTMVTGTGPDRHGQVSAESVRRLIRSALVIAKIETQPWTP